MLIAAGIEVMWPGTNASIPSGWTRSSDMDSRHVKAAASGVDPDLTGGAATHTHTDPGHTHSITAHTHSGTSSGNATETYAQNGPDPGFQAAAHTHTASVSGSATPTSGSTAGGWGSGSSEPSYVEVIYITSDGTPNGFPANSWAFWDDSGALPTGWSLPAAGQAKFPKGAAPAADGGGTGGGGTHSHSASAHTHTFNSHSHTGGTSSSYATIGNYDGGASGVFASALSHSHTYTFDSGSTQANSSTSVASGSATYDPAYAKLAIVQNDTAGANAQVRHVALWPGLLSTIPTNWALCDGTNSTVDMRDLFVLGASALGEIGATGGAVGHSHSSPATHTHAYDHTHVQTFAVTSSSGSYGGGAGSVVAQSPHGHTATSGSATGTSGGTAQTAPTNSDTQPPFRTRAFIVLLATLTVTITAPADMSTITTPTPTISWTLGGGSGTQNDYQIIIYRADGVTVQYDSGQIASASTSITLAAAAGLINGQTYYFTVVVHDTSAPAQESTSDPVQVTTDWTLPATITGVATRATTEENREPW